MKILKVIVLMMLNLVPMMLLGQDSADINRINDEIITTIKKKYVSDSRQGIWTAFAHKTDKGIVVKGKTSEQNAYDAFKLKMNECGYNYIDSIIVYPSNKWGIVRISVAHLRAKPSHSAEIVSQALMGTPLRLLEKDGEWWRVQSPDGYISYIIGNSMSLKDSDKMNEWRCCNRVVVTSLDQIRAYNNPKTESMRDIVTDLVNGCIIEGGLNKKKDKVEIVLPDGRKCWVKEQDVTSIKDWANQKFDSDKIIETGYSMMGIPYLWGGMSTKALDCSGFARVCYFASGFILMRDASQQALTGSRIEAVNWKSCQAGDLLFFGNAKTKRVTHVAIYEKDGHYLHSSGRVKRNSVDPESEDYLTTPFLHAIRVNGNEGTFGITKVAKHSWYFNQEK